MFNSSKNTEIKTNAGHLLESVKENVVDITHEASSVAKKLGKKVQSKSLATKSEAMALLESVREFIGPKVATDTANEIKEQLAEQLVDWKDSIRQEVVHALQVGKTGSQNALQKRTLVTLSAVLGAGLLIGYLVGSSRSEEEEPETEDASSIKD
jgi:hypothetical protein